MELCSLKLKKFIIFLQKNNSYISWMELFSHKPEKQKKNLFTEIS